MKTSWRYLILYLLLFVVVSFYVFKPSAIVSPNGHSNEHELDDTETDRSSWETSWWFHSSTDGGQGKSRLIRTTDEVNSGLKIELKKHSNDRTHLKNLLGSRSDVTPFDFDGCRMSNCFDFDRCKHGPVKVHIVPAAEGQQTFDLNITGESNIIHKRIIAYIKQSKYYEPDASKACLFILSDDTLDRDPLSQSFSPSTRSLFNSQNQFGMNHLVFNLYSGSWPDYRENDFAGLNIGAAILAKASNSLIHHRPNFDISIPLFSHTHGNTSHGDYTDLASTQDRAYFVTFKGKRYVIGSGSETRNSLYHLNNQDDVITLTTCRHGKKWRDTQDFRCAEDESTYNDHDFTDLMRGSTFCLTPRGRRLGSFRFLEALSYGCIPVVLSDGWTWPFDEMIDWSDVAIQFNENLVLLVPDLLRDIEREKVLKMRQKCRLLYDKYFATIEKIVSTTLDVIERRIISHLSTKD